MLYIRITTDKVVELIREPIAVYTVPHEHEKGDAIRFSLAPSLTSGYYIKEVIDCKVFSNDAIEKGIWKNTINMILKKKCTNCGSRREKDAKYCHTCGNNLV